MDENGPGKRIADPSENKAQAEVNDEALGVTKDLGVEEGEPQLAKLHLGEEGEEELENPHSDGKQKPHGTQREHHIGVHTRRGGHPNHHNGKMGESSHGPRQS